METEKTYSLYPSLSVIHLQVVERVVMFLQVLEEKEESKIKEFYRLDGESECAGGNAILYVKGPFRKFRA